jgi:hypothetical protein
LSKNRNKSRKKRRNREEAHFDVRCLLGGRFDIAADAASQMAVNTNTEAREEKKRREFQETASITASCVCTGERDL